MKSPKITPLKSYKAWLWIIPISGFFILPFLALLLQLLNSTGDVWLHLWDTVLPSYLGNSLLLMLAVGTGTVILGVSSAWVVAAYEFPGRRVFEWMLILPLAMPAYIVAYAYTWLLDISGPVQMLIRGVTDLKFGAYYFPNIRSVGGATLVMTFVLFPYVYMLCRAAFISQSQRLWEVNQSLRGDARKFFFSIALPLARPALFGGLALVLMETLADYGTVDYFGVKTLTTGVFKSWFGLGSLPGAAQIATIILTLVLCIIFLEKWLRGDARFDEINKGQKKVRRQRLVGKNKWLVFVWCATIVAIGFIFPVLILIAMAFKSGINQWFSEFMVLTRNTVGLAVLVAFVTVLIAILLVTMKRYSQNSKLKALTQLLSMGYAIPGLVIAVGVTIAYGWLDGGINSLLQIFNYPSIGLVFSGGFLALITAYIIRFLAVAIQPIDAGFQGISLHLDEVSQLTGKNNWQTFIQVHLPLLKGGFLTALLLVFVDLLKELPATLVLRPFNFNTLAVKTYELASDERLADSALPALCIVLVGILPVLLINNRIKAGHD